MIKCSLLFKILSGNAYDILILLRDVQCSPISDLSSELGVQKETARYAVHLLLQHDLVKRRQNKIDDMEYHYVITQDGRAVLNAISMFVRSTRQDLCVRQ